MALMVTREPHCFEKILGAIKSGGLKKADPALVLSNRRDLEPLARKSRLAVRSYSLGGPARRSSAPCGCSTSTRLISSSWRAS